MQQRHAMHSNDAVHATLTTGGAAVIYGLTLMDWVAVLWAAYVAILIITRLPELTDSITRIRACLRARWERWTGSGK